MVHASALPLPLPLPTTTNNVDAQVASDPLTSCTTQSANCMCRTLLETVSALLHQRSVCMLVQHQLG
jgi:hypothetical protein